ncbi:MAG: hypothetical protein J6W27_03720 [Alphaproteobacteria bacterium]|nr:hypothetical protein [Alphaproteobacteria bacterium]
MIMVGNIKNSAPKHRWTYEEDKFCVEKYFEHYVWHTKIGNVINEIQHQYPHLKEGSVRMKIQNIKYLINEQGNIQDTCPLNPLENASQQNRRAFNEVINRK